MTMTHTRVGPDSAVLVADPGDNGTILHVRNVGEVPIWLGDADVTQWSGDALPVGSSRSLPGDDVIYAIAGPTGWSMVQATTATDAELDRHSVSDLIDGGEQSPELLNLLHAQQERPLTEAERLRLAAFTWATNPTLELALVLKARHPDIYALMTTDVPVVLASYEKRRTDARDGGRRVAEPTAADIAAIDAAVKTFEAVRHIPSRFRDIETRNRDAFRAAFLAGGVDAATMAAWRSWLQDLEDSAAFAGRRAAAAQAVGLNWTFGGREMPPSFLREMEQAVGGGRGHLDA